MTSSRPPASLSPDEREASALTTPPARLAELARSEHPAVRRALASNPSTPLDVLSWLLRQFPAEVSDNPALALHLLTHPRWFRQLPLELRLHCAACRPLPPTLLQILVSLQPEGHVFHTLLSNPSLPEETALWMAREGPVEIRAAVVHHRVCTPALLEHLTRDPAVQVRAAVARRGDCPLDLLKQLSTDPEADLRSLVAHRLQSLLGDARHRDNLLLLWMVNEGPDECRTLAARHRRCPASLFVRLARDPCVWVRESIARRPGCPSALRQQLAADPDPHVRAAAASQLSRPASLIARLATDEAREVRAAVAGRWTTPRALLETLASDPAWEVRTALARNSSCPPAVGVALARDPEAHVRQCACTNQRLPLELIEALCRDPSWDVRESAQFALQRALATDSPGTASRPAARPSAQPTRKPSAR